MGLLGNSGPQEALGNIDPRTGRPYAFSTGFVSPDMNWRYSDTPSTYMNGDTEQQTNNPFSWDPAMLRSVGFNGPSQVNSGGSGQSEQWGTNPELTQFLASRGLRPAVSTGGVDTGQYYGRLFDAQGNPTGSETHWDQNDDPGNVFLMGMLGAAGGAGLAAYGAAGAAGGGAAGGAADAAGAAGSSGAGISAESSAYGALENGAAYGGGYGAPITASSEAGLGGASVGAAEGGTGALGTGAGYVTPGLGAGGAAGGGLLGTGITASQLGGYAGSALQFAGSPAGGAVIGALAGGLGSGSGLNSATSTQQNRLDPRLANYVYGQNGNTGLLGNVNNVYSQQLAQGGLNDLQRQGMSNQLGVLNSPTYQSGFNSMRNVGQGLLNQPQAANPFTSGQAQLQQPNPQIAAANQARMPYMPGGK